MVPRPRRQVLGSGLAVGLAGLSGCLLGFGGCSDGRTVHEADLALPESAGWPTYQYDAANTGYNPDASGPATDVGTAWRYSACVENGAGVVVGGGNAYAGGLVVDGNTGRARGGEWGESTSTVADGTVYVGRSDLQARDAATGEPLWTFPTAGNTGRLPAPTVASGTVYVPGGIDDPTLYAVDAATGEERWRVETTARVDTPAAVRDGTVYVADDDTTLHAIDATTGDERWRVTHDTNAPLATPVVAGGRIYLEVDGENGEVHALLTADGSTAWRRRVGHPLRGPVAVAEGTVYAAGRHRDYGGKLTALDAADGRIGWTATPDAYELGPPAVADGVVYVGSRAAEYGGTLYAVDATTGDERWRLETRGVEFGDYVRSGVTGSPAVVDEYVFVATAPGDVYAIAGRG